MKKQNEIIKKEVFIPKRENKESANIKNEETSSYCSCVCIGTYDNTRDRMIRKY